MKNVFVFFDQSVAASDPPSALVRSRYTRLTKAVIKKINTFKLALLTTLINISGFASTNRCLVLESNE